MTPDGYSAGSRGDSDPSGEAGTSPPKGGHKGVAGTLDQLAAELEKLVKFANGQWEASLKIPMLGAGDDVMPSMLMFREVIETMGGIAALVRHSWPDVATPCIRSLFEMRLQLEFLLKGDVKANGHAYLIAMYHRERRRVLQQDVRTPEGKQYDAMRKRDRAAKSIRRVIEEKDLQAHLDRIDKALDSCEGNRQANARYQVLRSKGQRGSIPWYTIVDPGITSLQALADRLQFGASYEILYRGWSEDSHALNVIQGRLASGKGSKVLVSPIGLPLSAQQVVTTGLTLGLDSTRIYMEHYAPGGVKGFRDWYLREMRETFKRLHGPPIITLGEADPR